MDLFKLRSDVTEITGIIQDLVESLGVCLEEDNESSEKVDAAIDKIMDVINP